MKPFSLLAAATILTTARAQTYVGTPGPLDEITLTAENISVTYIGYGARITKCLVPDRNGKMQDIALGYDNASYYPTDTATNHTYFGAVVGRFANRIKNGTFVLDGQTYHIPTNENNGTDTLHGGTVGYDQRNWTVVAVNDSSVSFQLIDTAFEGFPGSVLTTATYSVASVPSGPQGQMQPRLTTQLVSVALDQQTPIMLSNHIYWNLNAFENANILDNTYYWMPYSDRYIQTDGILVPNGTIATVQGRPIDFTSPRLVGTAVNGTAGLGYCGTGCTGIDNAFIFTRPGTVSTDSVIKVFSAWSSTTGIQMDMSTNQQGVQIYTCNGQNGSIKVKSDQGQNGGVNVVNKYGCFALEPQQYIDGINNPQWGIQNYEIFGPQTYPAINHAQYDFSTY